MEFAFTLAIILIIAVFLIGYSSIALEHLVKIDKAIPAVGMMAILWAIIALAHVPIVEVHDGLVLAHMDEMLLHHLGKTAEILMFLMGAMTIVEMVDHFNGFGAIKSLVTTRNKRALLWIMGGLAFFLSAIIDNLTATIVLLAILKKLIADEMPRKWFAGLIIIGANAGGAWSPIGDVTTTMLWIGNKVSTEMLLKHIFLPSLVCMAVPTLIASFLAPFKGRITKMETDEDDKPVSMFMLLLGLGMIAFVPVFKMVTHLPPWVGMMFGVAVVGSVAELKSWFAFKMSDMFADGKHESPLHLSLAKIEMPSILFFLGILMAVGALESIGLVFHIGETVRASIPDDWFVVMLGFGSAIIDNVPLVAASMGMFQLPLDHHIWHFIAFSAGTGGSMLIIGSAAGVVAMGMERIDFMWYLKKIAWLALIGFLAGCGAFALMVKFLF